MKVIVVSSYSPSLVNFRGHLLSSLLDLGHKVSVVAPEFDSETSNFMDQRGIQTHTAHMKPTGLNPFSDFKTYLNLKTIFQKEKPDIVLCYTIKPVIYGSIAAKAAGIASVFSMITGLGSVFIGDGIRVLAIRFLAKNLYKLALQKNKKIFFQNKDDMALFTQSNVVKKNKSVLISGSGIDCKNFGVTPLPTEMCFTLIARLIKDKGIFEYLEAAKVVKKIYPETVFKLIGPLSNNPSSITQADLDEIIQEGVVDYLGVKRDVRGELRKTSAFVLPSYREGIPRSVLEAMAMGRPIITTDVPGCRETVIDGENGLLVPAKDVNSLVKAMLYMIENQDKLPTMGAKSRDIAEQKYEVKKVNKSILDTIFQ